MNTITKQIEFDPSVNEILADPMKVLLALVKESNQEGIDYNSNKRKKKFLTYTEICTLLENDVDENSVSSAIDYLFDRQQITARHIIRGKTLLRAYAPATEYIQEVMTELFIATPFSRDSSLLTEN